MSDKQTTRRKQKKKRTPEDVIRAIKQRHEQGIDVTEIDEQARWLLNSAWRFFGGWREALVAAGVIPADSEYRDTQRWWSQRVLEVIRQRHKKERSLDAEHKGNRTLIPVALRYFNTWEEAIAAAGVLKKVGDDGQNEVDETVGD